MVGNENSEGNMFVEDMKTKTKLKKQIFLNERLFLSECFYETPKKLFKQKKKKKQVLYQIS